MIERFKVLSVIALVALLIGFAAEGLAQTGTVNPTTQMNKSDWPVGATIWSATGDQDSTTDTTIRAVTSGTVHCVTSVQVYALDTLGADHQFRILSNDTVKWVRALSAEGMVGAAGASEVVFPVPVCTTSGEALEVDTAGDPTDNLIFYNLQGYSYVSP